MSSDPIKKLRIIHFNDCYNVDEQKEEPKGGAPRFLTAVLSKIVDPDQTVVLFSGDIVGPSLLSTFTKGIHMATVLNLCKVECSVFGNHDFDFGVENLAKFVKETKFPWLMSNVIDKETNKPLGDGNLFHIIKRNGIKIGLIGIVEEEWLSTLATVSREDVIFLSYIDQSRKLAKLLKEEHNVDIVIALTHMRFKNDIELAKNVPEIDAFLGGHDHNYQVREVNDKIILKSGTDFREFSTVDLEVNLSSKKIVSIDIQKVDIISTKYEENEELKTELDKYNHLIETKLDEEIAQIECDLEGRFSKVRTEETNLGNFISDIVLAGTKSDCVILNSGTLRSDSIHKKGPFKLKDLVRILPSQYPLIVLEITGFQLWKALENGVSQYPNHEGRFPQVANIRFAFNPNKQPGERVDYQFIKVGDEYLDLEQKYKLTTKLYLSKGKDGYECLLNSKVLVNEEESVDLQICVQNYFEAIRILKSNSTYHTHHRLSLVPASCRKRSLSRSSGGSLKHDTPRKQIDHNMNIEETSHNLDDLEQTELEKCKLDPKVEGRIIKITSDEILQQLKSEREEFFKLNNQ